MATKQKIPIPIIEFGRILEYPMVYGQLIAQTVAIYKSKIRSIKQNLAKNKKTRIPRHPRTLLRESFNTAKNKLSYEEKFLRDDGLPTPLGILRSIEMMGKDMNLGYEKRGRTPFQKKLFLAPLLYGVAVGDFIDSEYEALLEKKKVGSANHSCPVPSNLKKELQTIREAMDNVFACDTAFGDCNNNSMASGHCMLSALILQDLYGGQIKSGKIDGVPHYWNRLCHVDVDLTGDQFGKPAIQIKKGSLYPDSFVFNRDPFETMNQDFNKEVWKKHCAFRKRVNKELKGSNKRLHNKLEKATKKLT